MLQAKLTAPASVLAVNWPALNRDNHFVFEDTLALTTTQIRSQSCRSHDSCVYILKMTKHVKIHECLFFCVRWQRLSELHAQTNQALMDGYEVPPKLQEERQTLETAIAGLRRRLKAMKVPCCCRADGLGIMGSEDKLEVIGLHTTYRVWSGTGDWGRE